MVQKLGLKEKGPFPSVFNAEALDSLECAA